MYTKNQVILDPAQEGVSCGHARIHPAPLPVASLLGLMKARSLSSACQMLSPGSAALLGLNVSGSQAQKPISAGGSMTVTGIS